MAIRSPLLEDVTIEGATGILINITGGPDLTCTRSTRPRSLIQQAAHEDANIIFGSVIDPNIGDEVRITVIATGFDRSAVRERATGSRGTGRNERASAPHAATQYESREYHARVRARAGGAAFEPRPPDRRAGDPAVRAPAVRSPCRAPGAGRAAARRVPVLPSRPGGARGGDADPGRHRRRARARRAGPRAVRRAHRRGARPRPHGSRLRPDAEPRERPDVSPDHRRKVEFPKVHPSLRHVLAEVEVDNELDVPTFLRRASE